MRQRKIVAWRGEKAQQRNHVEHFERVEQTSAPIRDERNASLAQGGFVGRQMSALLHEQHDVLPCQRFACVGKFAARRQERTSDRLSFPQTPLVFLLLAGNRQRIARREGLFLFFLLLDV